MAVEIRHSGQVVTVSSKSGTVTARSPSYGVTVASGVIAGGIPYTDEYEVTPTTSEQVLPTRMKTMANDVTVHEIPYHSTTNDAGGYTVSIAS